LVFVQIKKKFSFYLIFVGVEVFFDERLFLSLEEVFVHIDVDDCCSIFTFDGSLLNDKKKIF